MQKLTIICVAIVSLVYGVVDSVQATEYQLPKGMFLAAVISQDVSLSLLARDSEKKVTIRAQLTPDSLPIFLVRDLARLNHRAEEEVLRRNLAPLALQKELANCYVELIGFGAQLATEDTQVRTVALVCQHSSPDRPANRYPMNGSILDKDSAEGVLLYGGVRPHGRIAGVATSTSLRIKAGEKILIKLESPIVLSTSSERK